MVDKEKTISVSLLDVTDVDAFLKKLIDVNNRLVKLVKKNREIENDQFKLSVHFDVMDNRFVKNSGIDLNKILIAKKYNLKIDTHLMVDEPLKDGDIKEALRLGSDCITVHYESKDIKEALDYLRNIKDEKDNKIEIGISLKPDTEYILLEKYKNQFDKILIMTVEPGFGGQKYIEKMNNKISNTKSLFPNKIVQIDGGINNETIVTPIELGVDIFSIGSYLSNCKKEEELYNRLCILNIVKDIWSTPKCDNIDFRKRTLQIVENGYGKDDILIGLTVPQIRKITKKYYSAINYDIIQYFLNSRYHEYRQFGAISLTNILKFLNSKVDNENEFKNLYKFFEENVSSFNNWDLTDEVAKILGKYLLISNFDNQKIILTKYLNSKNLWQIRIAIVAMLELIRTNNTETVLYVCNQSIYSNDPLLNKAVGWILRELYKKNNGLAISYIKEKNKKQKLSSILLSYASEKMSKEEKKKLRE